MDTVHFILGTANQAKLDRCNIARILLKQQKYSNLPVAVTKMHVRM